MIAPHERSRRWRPSRVTREIAGRILCLSHSLCVRVSSSSLVGDDDRSSEPSVHHTLLTSLTFLTESLRWREREDERAKAESSIGCRWAFVSGHERCSRASLERIDRRIHTWTSTADSLALSFSFSLSIYRFLQKPWSSLSLSLRMTVLLSLTRRRQSDRSRIFDPVIMTSSCLPVCRSFAETRAHERPSPSSSVCFFFLAPESFALLPLSPSIPSPPLLSLSPDAHRHSSRSSASSILL